MVVVLLSLSFVIIEWNKGVKCWLAIGVVGSSVSAIYEPPHTRCLSALGEENEMGVEQT